MKIVVTNTETNEQAIISDMYLWFLLWEQMKQYREEATTYTVQISND
jgi:hypothetical protein